MEEQQVPQAPYDCFQLTDLEVFQSCEGSRLVDVNYFIWLNHATDGAPSIRFLYFLEMQFDHGEQLLLVSGEDSAAIRIGDPETLVKTADALKALHGDITIQRINASAQPLWAPAMAGTLQAVRLSKNEQGFYLNDALLLDFGQHQVLVEVNPQKEGLLLGLFE